MNYANVFVKRWNIYMIFPRHMIICMGNKEVISKYFVPLQQNKPMTHLYE